MKKGFSLQISASDKKINSYLLNNYDDIYFQSDNFDLLFEGVLLNKKKLLNAFALKDLENLLKELYLQKKEQIITLFEGEYRGFILDKIQNKLFVFTNITSTQRVFYGKFEDQIFIDTSLIRLNSTLKDSGISTQPNEGSLYQLLCFGNMPEEKTPIKNIKKLLDGCFLETDLESLNIGEKQYFDLAEVAKTTLNKEKAIDLIHEIFTESVILEYDKDIELGKDHLAFLSGGLDSRVAMIYALKNNFKIGNALCFSQSNYLDHTISEKIADEFDVHYEFIPLDGGDFLKKIDQLTTISEGMVFYTGGIHVQHALDHLQFENFALFHGGAIGDGVLGSFNSKPFRTGPTLNKFVGNKTFLPKVQENLREIMKNYETEELFLMRNLAFNRTILGAHVLEPRAYQTSPFMTKDLLSFAISLPENWKYMQNFYIEWINVHCKEATNHRWERTMLKPNATWKTPFGDKVVKRSFNIMFSRILKMQNIANMNPYEYYFKKNATLQKVYQNYFVENIARLGGYPELQKDVIELFSQKNFHNKCQAINILAIFKLYF